MMFERYPRFARTDRARLPAVDVPVADPLAPTPIRRVALGPVPAPASVPRGAVWLVLPTYNEAPNLEWIVGAAREVLATCTPEGSAVLVVDDGSPDGTGRIADRLADAHHDVHVVHRTRKEGLGPAYMAGFDYALARGAGYVFEMDADFSHDPRDLRRLLAVARTQADVVLGSRYVTGGAIEDWGPWRRLESRLGCWYARTLLGVGVRDLTGGYKCFPADALRTIDFPTVQSRGYAFQIDVTYRAIRRGLTVAEVPITFRGRAAGRSKMTSRIALEAAWRVVAMRLATRGRQPELSTPLTPAAQREPGS